MVLLDAALARHIVASAAVSEFMAQVDPKRLRVIRKTEQILVPERGARLGNFGVTDVSRDETWVTVSEWMQTWGPDYILPVNNKHGSDGSVWVARIQA
jgi:hypothetical protein